MLPGRVFTAGAGIGRLRPLLKAGKKNQGLENRAAETCRMHNETKKIISAPLGFDDARPAVKRSIHLGGRDGVGLRLLQHF
jgi:hypothetical protein